ncbi:hypothetical protein GCM10007854_25450 [Algimonas porphyrae]|uniref:Uncharacterized protein n=2 Tax=Algimonas porphyrae TaxID=1128113 RepID=A0ABQ5V4J4_9PROT|nr:hypothetical protein GCM10007854_25450 [Algimonas porphyrae]
MILMSLGLAFFGGFKGLSPNILLVSIPLLYLAFHFPVWSYGEWKSFAREAREDGPAFEAFFVSWVLPAWLPAGVYGITWIAGRILNALA